MESTSATFSWTKDGSPVVINIPHLFERTCNDSTTTRSALTIDSFQSSDNGTYQCMATDGQQCGCGNTTTLTGMHGYVDIDGFENFHMLSLELESIIIGSGESDSYVYIQMISVILRQAGCMYVHILYICMF